MSSINKKHGMAYAGLLLITLAVTSCMSLSTWKNDMPMGPMDKNARTDAADNDLEAPVVQPGDLVEIDYTLTMEDGRLLKTTLKQVEDEYRSKGMKRVDPDMFEWGVYGPEMFFVQSETSPGDITHHLIGLTQGENKRLTLSVDNGGIPVQRGKIRQFPRLKNVPLIYTMDSREYKKRFNREPVDQDKVRLYPYFDSVVSVSGDGQVMLTNRLGEQTAFKDKLGVTRVIAHEDHIVIELVPEINAVFIMKNSKGRVVSMDESYFTVDFNSPAAGKPLILDLTIVSVTKASQMAEAAIPWMENFDEGLDVVDTTGKPMVLYVYENECPQCIKMSDKVLSDLKIKILGDDFVWVKIDAYDDQGVNEKYDLFSYPAMLLINPDHSLYRELSGFRNANQLRKEIRLWMEHIDNANHISQKIDNTHDIKGFRG